MCEAQVKQSGERVILWRGALVYCDGAGRMRSQPMRTSHNSPAARVVGEHMLAIEVLHDPTTRAQSKLQVVGGSARHMK